MTLILNSRADFTLANARRAAWGGEAVILGEASQSAMAAARARFLRLIEDPEITIYGVTSGYGQHARFRLKPEERKAHAARPSIAPAASWGDPVPQRVARGIVFARLANFVEGHAGVSPGVANGVAAMLDGRALPPVPARGQGGAGEILSLSHLFLPLMQSVTLEEKDSLSLVNGSPAATALAVDAALAAAARLEVAAEVLALAAEGFDAPLGHFDAELDGYWNNPHDAWALERLRGLMDGGNGGKRRPYQTPVSFRIAPRILGQTHLAAEVTRGVAEESLPAVSDNPALLPPDAANPNGRAVSTGGYHNAQAPMALDMLTASYANLCVIAERMSAKLLDGNVSLMPHSLRLDDGAPYLGCLPMAATGYEEEARMLATATLLPGSESGGFAQNDVASPVFLAWSKQERAGLLLEHALAVLAPIALLALDVTGRQAPGPLMELAGAVRTHVPVSREGLVLGPATGALADWLRGRVYAA
jgi:histidine ammonia-lyase